MAARFWVGGTGTWDAADTTFWAATSGGAGGQSVPTSADTVTFDGSSGGGTVTVNHASLNVVSITCGAFTGTLDFSANDNNITITGTAGFSGSGAGTRTINLGDGTWTLSATSGGSLWNMGTTTNLTFNANGSTIAFTGNATSASIRGFLGGGLTYNVFSISAGAAGVNITGANTFATLNAAAPTTLIFPASVTNTITNAFTWTGTSGAPIGVTCGSTSAAATISVAAGSPTVTWGAVRNMTFAGGATFAANSSLDLGVNSGITITAPVAGSAHVIGG
jgi:hypothetical protein